MDESGKPMARLLSYIVCYALTQYMVRPLVPQYLRQLDAEPLAVGVVVAGYSIVPAALSLWASTVISSHTIRRLLGVGSLMIIAGSASLTLFTSLPVLFVGQMVGGSAAMFAVVAAQSYVQQISPAAMLARNFSLLVGAFSVADVIGPALGGLLARNLGYRLTFAVTAGIALLSLVVSRTFSTVRLQQAGPSAVTRDRVRLLTASPHYRLSLAVTTAAISIASLMMSFYPLRLAALGLSPGLVGVILSFRGMGQLTAPVLMGPLERAVGRVKILVGAVAVAAVVVGVMPLLSDAAGFMAASLALGCAYALIIPMSLVLATEHTPRRSRVMALALRFAVNRGTDALGPIIFGLSAQLWGLAAPFWTAAAYLTGSGVHAWRRRHLLEPASDGARPAVSSPTSARCR